MNIRYTIENILFIRREHKKWFEDIVAVLGRREVKHVSLKNGLQIEAPEELKWLMNQIFVRKMYTPAELSIDSDDVVIDIGAHYGVFTLYASQFTKNKIYAIEPAPRNFAVLEKNIRANGLKNIITYNRAVADTIGSAKFMLNPLHHQENQLHFKDLDVALLIPDRLENYTEVEVATTTLQEIMDMHAIERVGFLKIDCQGAEGFILQATPQSYLQRVNKIALEYHDHLSCLKHGELEKILQEAGFTTRVKAEKASSPLGLLYGWRV